MWISRDLSTGWSFPQNYPQVYPQILPLLSTGLSTAPGPATHRHPESCPQPGELIHKFCGQSCGSVDEFGAFYPHSGDGLWTGCGQITTWMLPGCYKVPSPEGRSSGKKRGQRLLLMWEVISCIWEKASRSLFMRLAILEVACMTVEWSRPPKAFPILGRDSSVSSRERYMATCRG